MPSDVEPRGCACPGACSALEPIAQIISERDEAQQARQELRDMFRDRVAERDEAIRQRDGWRGAQEATAKLLAKSNAEIGALRVLLFAYDETKTGRRLAAADALAEAVAAHRKSGTLADFERVGVALAAYREVGK